jgi:inward rectifier potassium channel
MAEEILGKEEQEDLGLGNKVIEENRTRFINKDGTFNVHRKGILDRGNFSPYHAVLNAPWWRFNLGILVYYIIANFIFSILYFMSGRNAFSDISNLDSWHRFGQLFFYSVQVITTLGTSPLHPSNVMSDTVLAIEAMVGMLGFALAASLLFARFSNPPVKILYSNTAVISPYKNIKAFMVRIINGRSNELVNISATISVSMTAPDGKRSFHTLALERNNVLTFPLNWTIVHPITKNSPLFGKTADELDKAHAEFVVNITAVDPDLSKTIYSRRSYANGEIVEGKFVYILERDSSGTVVVDPKRVSEIEKI